MSQQADLIVEYLEDLYMFDEELARKVRLRHLGYELSLTGDPLFDKWERQFAMGIEPDLDEGEDESTKRFDARVRHLAQKQYEETGEAIYIPKARDRYTGEAAELYELERSHGKLEEDMDFRDMPVDRVSDRYNAAIGNIPPEQFDEFMNSIGAVK